MKRSFNLLGYIAFKRFSKVFISTVVSSFVIPVKAMSPYLYPFVVGILNALILAIQKLIKELEKDAGK